MAIMAMQREIERQHGDRITVSRSDLEALIAHHVEMRQQAGRDALDCEASQLPTISNVSPCPWCGNPYRVDVMQQVIRFCCGTCGYWRTFTGSTREGWDHIRQYEPRALGLAVARINQRNGSPLEAWTPPDLQLPPPSDEDKAAGWEFSTQFLADLQQRLQALGHYAKRDKLEAIMLALQELIKNGSMLTEGSVKRGDE